MSQADFDICISQQGIFSLLLNIDSHKSGGPDNVPNKFLKLYEYLTIIFRASFDQHTFPTYWLTAKVTPVHKTGRKHNIENYRPISLTVSKYWVCISGLPHWLLWKFKRSQPKPARIPAEAIGSHTTDRNCTRLYDFAEWEGTDGCNLAGPFKGFRSRSRCTTY